MGKKFLKLHIIFLTAPVLLLFANTGSSTGKGKYTLSILLGKYNPAKDDSYQIIPPNLTTQTNMYLHRQALDAFTLMADEAKKAGFDIYINSAIRDFSTQKYIWESKFSGQRLVEGKNLKKSIPAEKARALNILEYSSMPGTSRHHWGTDIDLGFGKNVGQMLTNEAFESGEGLRFYNWLKNNAHHYGFCQPYKEKPEKRNLNLRYGYHEEKWHWSYKPLSEIYLKKYLENAEKFIPSGFEGSRIGADLYLDFVRNIHKDCQQ